MSILLLLPLLFGNFVERWSWPQGIDWGAGRILVGDTDRDGNLEFIFATYGDWPIRGIYCYELHLPDTWLVDTILYPYAPLLWDIGDFDGDGLYDVVMQCGSTDPFWVGISLFESPDSFSYPAQEVWRDTVGFALVQPISAYDVDQDGYAEIFKLGWKKDNPTVYYPFGIYEYAQDNQYDTVFMGTGLGSLSSTIAFGDFDMDDGKEFVVGNIDGWYQIWECIADNNYQLLEQQQLPTGNIKDCFSVPDADGDGKLEFVVKGFVIPTGEIHAFIFEAAGDNTYEIIKTFTLSGGDYYGGYSDVGDVDGDGVPEIALEGRQTVHIIKAAGNDSFYVWETLPGNASGSSVRVFDVDGNGLCEVIISGDNETRIYEYQVGIAETPGSAVEPVTLTVSPNPFTSTTTIRYTIQDPGYTTQDYRLKIYDATGRFAQSLHHESCIMDHGSVFVWDGKDDEGRVLPSGVYFVRLETLQRCLVQKLVKLK